MPKQNQNQHILIRLIALSILVVTLLFPRICPAIQVNSQKHLSRQYKEGELIVKFRNNTTASKSLSASKATSIRKLKHVNAHHIRLPAGTTVTKALEQYRSNPDVIYAEPNYLVHKLAITPDDTYFSSQWALSRIAAPTAWQGYIWPNPTSSSVIVAVLDTGIAYNHPDLQANLWTNPTKTSTDPDYYGTNFGGTTADPWDDDVCDSHGTHLAGIIGAVGNNSSGITGINWSARIMALKVLQCNDQCPDNCSGDIANISAAVDFAIDNGAKIINMSFELEEPSQTLEAAIQHADNAGVLVVSAAGNSGKNLSLIPAYPASFLTGNNIAVAASTVADTMATYSNYGVQTVHLAAPGGDYTGQYIPGLEYSGAVLSTVWLNNNTKTFTSDTQLYRTTAGTSMAAPHVAGAAALVWNRFPTLTHYQVKDRIVKSVDLLPAFSTTTISGGRLNLAKALGNLILSASNQSGTLPLSVTFTATYPLSVTTWQWDLGDGSYTQISGVTSSLSHTFQTAGTYVVRVKADNTEASVTINVSSAPSPSPSSGGGGGCFIATAAWGSQLHPKVALLRAFRDKHLLTNLPGRLFVKTYYAVSPPIADYIRQHDSLRTATRWALTPVVAIVGYLEADPFTIVFSLFICTLALVASILYTRRHFKKAEGTPYSS